jgi:hypothetical protein
MIMATCKLGKKGCWKDGKCHYSHDCENKVLTNADRIRAMSDEELYDLFREIYNAGSDDATAWGWGTQQNTFVWEEEWLKQPADQPK